MVDLLFLSDNTLDLVLGHPLERSQCADTAALHDLFLDGARRDCLSHMPGFSAFIQLPAMSSWVKCTGREDTNGFFCFAKHVLDISAGSETLDGCLLHHCLLSSFDSQQSWEGLGGCLAQHCPAHLPALAKRFSQISACSGRCRQGITGLYCYLQCLQPHAPLSPGTSGLLACLQERDWVDSDSFVESAVDFTKCFTAHLAKQTQADVSLFWSGLYEAVECAAASL